MIERYKFIHVVFPLAVIFLLVAALLVTGQRFPVQASSSVRYVAPGGNCGGVSPCYASIQDAVDAASAGDEIRIAAGQYTGINHRGGLSQVVYIDKYLTLRGGYTTANWSNPDPATNVTEINALGQGRVMVITNTVSVTLDGLRLTYGDGSNLGGLDPWEWTYGDDAGGGVLVRGSNLTLKNTQILSSTITDGLGGGIALVQSQAMLQDCTISDNSAKEGGGIGSIGSTVQIQRCRLENNVAESFGGGGVKAIGRSGVVTQMDILDSTIEGNTGGGGVSLVSVDLITITNSTISNNSGDGISIGGIPDSALIQHNTIQGNVRGVLSGSGISTPGNNVTITDNLIADNHGDVYGGVHISGGAPVFQHNTVRGNSAYNGWGGGVHFHCTGSSVDTVFTDNVIEGNYIKSGIRKGGGLSCLVVMGSPSNATGSSTTAFKTISLPLRWVARGLFWLIAMPF